MTAAVTDWGVTDWVDPDGTTGLVFDQLLGELELVFSAALEPVTGTAAWTEAADTCVAAGVHGVAGTSSWTEAADTCAASGTFTAGVAVTVYRIEPPRTVYRVLTARKVAQ